MRARDTQFLGRLFLVASRFRDGAQHRVVGELVEPARPDRRRRRWNFRFSRGIALEVLHAQFFHVAEHQRFLHALAELADVAGPIAVGQVADDVAADARHRHAIAAAETVHEVLQELGNVLAPMAQGRDAQHDAAQAVIQIQSESLGVGNRMLSRRTIEAESLLLHGALPHEVDGVLTRFGFPMGPFAMTDMAGVDVNWRTRKARGLPLAIADAICEAGRLGQKTGKGYYRYAPGSRAPIPDPQVQALIEGIAQTAGIERESFSDTEIRERLLYPMINEGVRILSEGVIRRASDIDVVWRYGYGWPAASVGPMRYADEAGLVAVCDALDRMARKTGRESLVPHPLLRELAATGRSLAAQPVPEKTPISS
nr:3-hydroxyacyl-CoA dehydrogenase family protein [Achromobacter sp. DMS1]